MRDFHDAKAMAQSLRTALLSKGFDLSHGECLDLVAKEFGLDNWNVLAAKIAGDQAPVELIDAIPIIRIFEAVKAKEFYLAYLGFKLDFEHRFEPSFPLFAQVSRYNIVLNLSEHHGDGSPGIIVDIRVKGIEALHQELEARRDLGRNRPAIEDVDWGKQLQVWDPFGNRLRFTQLSA